MEIEQIEELANHIKALMKLEKDKETLDQYLEEHPIVGEDNFLLEGLAFAERVGVSATPEVAQKLLEQLHELALHVGSVHQITSHLSLGRHHRLKGDLNAASSHIDEAKALMDEFEASSMRGHLMLEQAALLVHEQAHEEAAGQLADALAHFEELEDNFGISQTLLSQGHLFHLQGDLKQAEEALERSMSLQKQLDEPTNLANTLLTLGALYQAQGKLSEAEDMYQKALPIYQGVSDARGLANACKALGFLYQSHGDHEGALSALQNALQIFQQIHARRELIQIYEALAESFSALDHEDEAQACRQQAEALKARES